MQRTCENCGRQNPANWGVCGSCARPFPRTPPLQAALAKARPTLAAAAPVAATAGNALFKAARVVALSFAGLAGIFVLATLVDLPRPGPSQQELDAQHQREVSAKLSAEAERGVALYKRFEAAVSRGEVMVGMTADQALRAWPFPRHMSTTTTAQGKSELWIYGERSDRTVYIQNGVVTAIHRAN